MARARRVLVAMAVVGGIAVVIAGATRLLDHSVAWSRASRYEREMHLVCDAVDEYRRTHQGEVPMVDRLVASGALKQRGIQGTAEELMSRFDIVTLPGCVMRSGEKADSYVVTYRTAQVSNWATVYVEGKAVHLRK